jgi:hypothetical protein
MGFLFILYGEINKKNVWVIVMGKHKDVGNLLRIAYCICGIRLFYWFETFKVERRRYFRILPMFINIS